MRYAIKDRNGAVLGYIEAESSDEAKAMAIQQYNATWTVEEAPQKEREVRG